MVCNISVFTTMQVKRTDATTFLLFAVMCGPAVSKRPRLEESEFYDSSSCASDESCYTWQGYETGMVSSFVSIMNMNLEFRLC